MGVSISNYRVSIGLFNFKCNKCRIKCKSNDLFDSHIYRSGSVSGKFRLLLLLSLLIFSTDFLQSSLYSLTSKLANNKVSHIYNGNMKSNSLKMIQLH